MRQLLRLEYEQKFCANYPTYSMRDPKSLIFGGIKKWYYISTAETMIAFYLSFKVTPITPMAQFL